MRRFGDTFPIGLLRLLVGRLHPTPVEAAVVVRQLNEAVALVNIAEGLYDKHRQRWLAARRCPIWHSQPTALQAPNKH